MSHWLDKVIELLEADTMDLRDLAKIAGADPKIFYRGIDPRALDLSGQDLDGIDFGDGADFYAKSMAKYLAHVCTARRQEERLSLLLLEIVQMPERRRNVIDAFPGETVYEQKVLKRVRARLGGHADNWQFEAVFYDVANDMYQLCFSERKGRLLFYFAKHLGYLPAMRQFIRGKFNRTVSHHVLAFADETERMLSFYTDARAY